MVSEIKRVSLNLMSGLLRPCRTPYAETFMYAPSTWQSKTAIAKFQRRISMHHAVMRICISYRLSIVCAQKWGFGEF